MLEKKTFAVEHNGKVIGTVGIEKYNEKIMPEFNDKAGREIGFVLSKDYWGKGLMPEAVAAVIKWLFYEIKLDFIVCSHSPTNLRSGRVQEKCGFKPYKMSEHKTTWGEVRESCCNILLRESFVSSQSLREN